LEKKTHTHTHTPLSDVHTQLAAYLAVVPGRDVIEAKVGDMDISGWDVRKALELARRSNSSLVEWLLAAEPLVADAAFVSRLRAVVLERCSLRALGFSWLQNAKNDLEKCINNTPEPVPRDYLYVLRPILNVRWLLDHAAAPTARERLPPSRFLDVLERSAASVPGPVLEAVRRLAEEKVAGRARAPARHNMLFEGWIADVSAEWKKRSHTIPQDEPPSDQLNSLFHDTVVAATVRTGSC